MDRSEPLSSAKTRLLHLLKTRGPQSAADLAGPLGITEVAVRQHLAAMSEAGLVAHRDERGQVGRPRRIWSVADTPEAQARFPDSHAELTLGLLEAARRAFGADGIDRLLEERKKDQIRSYRDRIPADAPLADRVAALSRIRAEEGYLAEWRPDGDGFLLLENHCPICAAAKTCAGICRTERELFQGALGEAVRVERTEHILSGARRCAYRIQPGPDRPPGTSPAG